MQTATAIGEIRSREVVRTKRDATAAARRMREYHVGSVVVADVPEAKRIPTGMVTDRGITVAVVALGLDCEAIQLGDRMAGELVRVVEDWAIAEVVARMQLKVLGRSVVTNSSGHLIGVVAADDARSLPAEARAGLATRVGGERKCEAALRKVVVWAGRSCRHPFRSFFTKWRILDYRKRATPAQGFADAFERAGYAQPARGVAEAAMHQNASDFVRSPDVTRSARWFPRLRVRSRSFGLSASCGPSGKHLASRQRRMVGAGQRLPTSRGARPAVPARACRTIKMREMQGFSHPAKASHSVAFDLYQRPDAGHGQEYRRSPCNYAYRAV